MSKSVLGRGLGELLERTQTSADPGVVSATADGQVSSSHGVYVSPGVKTILQGAKEPNSNSLKEATAEIQAYRGADYWPIVRAMLAVADLALLSVCGLFLWRAAGTATLLEAASCTAAIAVGAVLACVCLLLGSEKLQPLVTQRR